MDVALPTWIRIDAETEYFIPTLYQELEDIIANKPAEILKINQVNINIYTEKKTQEKLLRLQDMQTIEVFEKCVQQNGQLEEQDWKEIKGTFGELLNWMEEQDVE